MDLRVPALDAPRPGSGNPAPPPAAGVFHGIRASLGVRLRFGRPRRPNGPRPGCRRRWRGTHRTSGCCRRTGALHRHRWRASTCHRGSCGGTAVPAEQILQYESDVYAPCAVGGVLNAETVPRLRCRIVAGSANNQLANPEAELLRARGILYAPDYVINGGGAIALVGLEQLGWSTPELDAALERIGHTLRQIYERAEERGISTAAAAEALADERLQAA